MTDVIQIEQQGGVVWLWLNRLDRLNALNDAIISRLAELFSQFSTDSSVKAIVLAGRGRAFCAGFDIEWMAQRTPESLRADRGRLNQVYDTIEHCPKPLISAVHGSVMGGGLILTLVSDIVLASDDTLLGVPEINIGIFPSIQLLPRLERVVGIRAAKMMALTGNPVDAATALRIGLVTQVVPMESLYTHAQQLAEKLATSPSVAIESIKTSFARHSSPDFIAWETDIAVKCWEQPEREVAMQAFLARRKRP